MSDIKNNYDITKDNEYNNFLQERNREGHNKFESEYLSTMLEEVKRDPKRVKDIPTIYKDNYQEQYIAIVKEALSRDGLVIKYLPEFQDSIEMAKIATSKTPHAIGYFDENVKDNDSIMIPLIEADGFRLRDASPRLKDSNEIVLKAINNGGSLEHASSRLKKDKAFVEECMEIKVNSFKHADSSIKGDKTFCLDLINKGYLEIYNDMEFLTKRDPEVIQAVCNKASELNIKFSHDSNYYKENPYEFSQDMRIMLTMNSEKIKEAREEEKSFEL